MRNRAERRALDAKTKKKAGKLVDRTHWIGGPLDATERERIVGKTAAVHGKGCSCPGCGNPRRHLGQKTIAEKAQDEAFREVEKDIGDSE